MQHGVSNIDIIANSMNDLVEKGDPVSSFYFDTATLLLGKRDTSKMNGTQIVTEQGQLKYPEKMFMADDNGCVAQKVKSYQDLSENYSK